MRSCCIRLKTILISIRDSQALYLFLSFSIYLLSTRYFTVSNLPRSLLYFANVFYSLICFIGKKLDLWDAALRAYCRWSEYHSFEIIIFTFEFCLSLWFLISIFVWLLYFRTLSMALVWSVIDFLTFSSNLT